MDFVPSSTMQLTRRRLLVWIGMGAGSLAISSSLIGETPSFGTGIDGNPIHTLATPGTRSIALIYIATDCPISNRYLPEIARLATGESPRGVRLWLVYPNPSDDVAAVRAHRKIYPVIQSLALLVQPNPVLLRRSHVHVTPEAAIFSPEAMLSQDAKWHGRIDDRYLTFGRQRPAATRHDLADAIDAVLAGRAPARPAAPPVGCAIISRS